MRIFWLAFVVSMLCLMLIVNEKPSTPPAGLPDIQILETGNPYGVQGLADNIAGVDSLSIFYGCPIAVFNGGYITDAPAQMVNFLQIKVMKIDPRGNELFFSEVYKSDYGFSADCLPGLVCFEQHTRDTIFQNQYDAYFNQLFTSGVGSYIVEVIPNSQGLIRECPGCGNDQYFFGFDYTRSISNGILIWNPVRNDALLRLPGAKSALKNHK